MGKKITIQLHDRGPARIDPDEWPITRGAEWSKDSTVFSVSAYHMGIRAHEDGRLIVFGASVPCPSSKAIPYGCMLQCQEVVDSALQGQATVVAEYIGVPRHAIQDLVARLLAPDLD